MVRLGNPFNIIADYVTPAGADELNPKPQTLNPKP
jgi:hypothetical protein